MSDLSCPMGWDIEIYYVKWAHTILETEKSQDLPSASWRPKMVYVPVRGQDKMR